LLNQTQKLCLCVHTFRHIAFLYNYAHGIGFFNPFRNAKYKAWQTCLCFKVVKFHHFKIRVVYLLPGSQKFKCVTCSYPILDYIGRTALRSHSFLLPVTYNLFFALVTATFKSLGWEEAHSLAPLTETHQTKTISISRSSANEKSAKRC
jgi:hypothetical protein